MVLFRRTMKTGKMVMRYTLGVILAGFIFALANWLVTTVGSMGIIVSTLFTIIVAAYYVPFILKTHPGTESLLDLIVGIVIGLAMLNFMTIAFGITIPAAFTIMGLNLFGFLLAITSFWLADTIVLKVMKKL